jgi:hypothetical protein
MKTQSICTALSLILVALGVGACASAEPDENSQDLRQVQAHHPTVRLTYSERDDSYGGVYQAGCAVNARGGVACFNMHSGPNLDAPNPAIPIPGLESGVEEIGGFGKEFVCARFGNGSVKCSHTRPGHDEELLDLSAELPGSTSLRVRRGGVTDDSRTVCSINNVKKVRCVVILDRVLPIGTTTGSYDAFTFVGGRDMPEFGAVSALTISTANRVCALSATNAKQIKCVGLGWDWVHPVGTARGIAVTIDSKGPIGTVNVSEPVVALAHNKIAGVVSSGDVFGVVDTGAERLDPQVVVYKNTAAAKAVQVAEAQSWFRNRDDHLIKGGWLSVSDQAGKVRLLSINQNGVGPFIPADHTGGDVAAKVHAELSTVQVTDFTGNIVRSSQGEVLFSYGNGLKKIQGF